MIAWFKRNLLAQAIVGWVIVGVAAFSFIRDALIATIFVTAFVLGSLPRLLRNRRKQPQ